MRPGRVPATQTHTSTLPLAGKTQKGDCAHDFHFLVIPMLRQSRSDPGVHPALRKPIYPKQPYIAQGSYVRAVSSEFVPVQRILHKLISKKRDCFIVHALRTF